MSMQIDNGNTVQLVQHSQSDDTAQNQAKLARESMDEWVYSLILQGLKNLGNAQERKGEEEGGQDVASTGPISMEALKSSSLSAIDASTLSTESSTATLNALFEQNRNTDNQIFEDAGQNPNMAALLRSNFSFSASARNGDDGPIIISADNENETPNAGAADPSSPANNAPPAFGTDSGDDVSIYGLAALVLLTTMENKRNIVANRLDQIETTNNRVQTITHEISRLKASGVNLDSDDAKDKAPVNVSVLRTMASNNYKANGELDEADTQEIWDKLGLSEEDIAKIKTGDENETIDLNKNSINIVAEKLTSQSEALSTQNQTRNIKLQQQISELQVSTQMTSAIIDQIKTLGSGIAQRL